MDGVAGRPGNGPALTPYTATPFQAGLIHTVTQGGMWLQGFYWWVPTGADTAAQKFCLWSVSGAGGGTAGQVVAGSTVTSCVLTANAWNLIPLATPVQVAIGGTYVATTAWTPAHGFPDTNAQFGAGDPYSAGITNGPIMAFGDDTQGGTNGAPYAYGQGLFGTANSDPTAGIPAALSSSGNFWIDVSYSDTAPAGYAGSYRLWPDKADANSSTVQDASVNYDVATEFALSVPCVLNKIWYYSPSGTAQLATACSVFKILSGGLTGSVAATTAAPSWSGAAGSGWVSCSFTGVTLPAGKYKVGVYNGTVTPDGWNAKDAQTDYWRNGAGGGGITNGPLSAPNLSSSSLAYNFNGNAGGTPPYSDGTTLAGQPTFSQGTPDQYPYLVALVASPTAGSTQNYWVDVEVTVAPAAPAGPGGGAGGDDRWGGAKRRLLGL
jgi:hypothetical protein